MPTDISAQQPAGTRAADTMPTPGTVHEKTVQRVLLAGFLLVIALLVMDEIVDVRGGLSTRANVSTLAESQFHDVALIDEVQRLETSLGSVVYELSVGATPKERVRLKEEIASIRRGLDDVSLRFPQDDPDGRLWREVQRTASVEVSKVERLLASDSIDRTELRAALSARAALISATAALIRANHARAEHIRREIESVASAQLLEDVLLLTPCLLVACLCAWYVLRTAARLFRQITEQANELGRVSWQLLEKQEDLARRLAHELHDELGQSLTALKANFTSLVALKETEPQWVEDCSQLLKDSIRSTHEIAQLLRPTILDDFGLDSALAWLCDRFEERNRIEVMYESDFHGRLDAQTETHLFRIAQEALTNVARHAEAKYVEMSLIRKGDTLKLTVLDDGRGMPETVDRSQPHLGLTGMRARARSLGGELSLRNAPEHGAKLEVVLPWKEPTLEEDPHLVGR